MGYPVLQTEIYPCNVAFVTDMPPVYVTHLAALQANVMEVNFVCNAGYSLHTWQLSAIAKMSVQNRLVCHWLKVGYFVTE